MKTLLALLIAMTSILTPTLSVAAPDQFAATFTFKKEIRYVLNLPSEQSKPFPLIVFLHGSGERGTNLDIVTAHSPFSYAKLIGEPVALLAPQCPEGQWWDSEMVHQLIVQIASQYNVDKSRIYLTGLSMGGTGVWKLAQAYPSTFAAIAPVCGPVDMEALDNVERLKDMPTHIYHGGMDDLVPPSHSIDIYQALKKINKNVELFIFPNDNHNSWDSTYSNPAFYQWLLQQRRL